MFNNFISSSTVQSIKDAMTPVATAIGQGAQYGWTILIKQQYVVAATDVVWAIGLLLIIVGIWKVAQLAFKEQAANDEKNKYNDGGAGILGALIVVVGLAVFIFMCMFITDAIGHIINPDFYALQFLLDTVKPASQ